MPIDYTQPPIQCISIKADIEYSQGLRIKPNSFCIFADGHVEFRNDDKSLGYWTFRRVLVIESLDGTDEAK